MDISVVIPNYNGKDLLKKNLPKVYSELENYKDGNFEIIIVDDASEDESLALLDQFIQKYQNLKILRNEKNLGFSPTVNIGFRAASGEIVILLNTDIYPEKGFLESLLSHFTN